MEAKPFTIIAAASAACFTGPCNAQELHAPSTMVFVELPFDGGAAKDHTLNYGLRFAGSDPSRSVRIDQRSLEGLRLSLDSGGAGAGTFVVAGAIGLLVVAAGSHHGSSSSSQQLAPQQQPQPPSGGTPPPPPPTPGGCPAQCQ